uniref:Uncharacterized protein n=1 Tax=Kalanchoe fedtschenkoi TaxID=63787 RepID=A0A7N0UCI3_KALFE
MIVNHFPLEVDAMSWCPCWRDINTKLLESVMYVCQMNQVCERGCGQRNSNVSISRKTVNNSLNMRIICLHQWFKYRR